LEQVGKFGTSETGGRLSAKYASLEQIQGLLVPLLKSRSEVLFAYIFGSLARGTTGPLSDVDIAIYVDETLIPGDLPFGYKSELLTEIMSCLKRNDVDLVILNQAPTLLRFQVLRSGKLIYCRSPRARVRFTEEVFRDYQDLRPLLDVQRYYLKKRLQEGKFGVGKDG